MDYFKGYRLRKNYFNSWTLKSVPWVFSSICRFLIGDCLNQYCLCLAVIIISIVVCLSILIITPPQSVTVYFYPMIFSPNSILKCLFSFPSENKINGDLFIRSFFVASQRQFHFLTLIHPLTPFLTSYFVFPQFVVSFLIWLILFPTNDSCLS